MPIVTSKNKEILWYIAGATIVVLVALYLFVPPVHSWVNSVIGRDIEGERIDVPRDSLLDSLLMADTTLVGVVRPVDGPAPAHVEGFGEGPLPPAPSEDNLPNKNELSPEEQAQLENIAPSVEDILDIERHSSSNPAVNKKIAECRLAFDKLISAYREYQTEPSPKLKTEGAKQKEALLKSLTQLMKLSQTKNDDAGMEEAADLRREVNKMEF